MYWSFLEDLLPIETYYEFMLKIYNPQILFWVQTQNLRIYESTNL